MTDTASAFGFGLTPRDFGYQELPPPDYTQTNTPGLTPRYVPQNDEIPPHLQTEDQQARTQLGTGNAVEGDDWNGRATKLIVGRNCAIFFLVVGILMITAASVCLGLKLLPAAWAKPVIISLFAAGGVMTLASLISLCVRVNQIASLKKRMDSYTIL
jgi:hypothetical protein